MQAFPTWKKPKVRNYKSRNTVTETAQPGPSTSNALDADSDSSMADKGIPEDHMDGERSSAVEMQHVQEMGSGELIVINSGSDIPTRYGWQLILGGNVGWPQLEYGLPLLTDLAPEDLSEEFIIEDIIARSARDSGVIDFGPRLQDGPLDDTLPAIVCTITVHRGLVSRNRITFFSKNENVDTLDSQLTTFEIQMLKEDGSTEVAEENVGVMRDALWEFWDTFYLHFTEVKTYKIPVLRHDMSETQWTAVAAVIKMGYQQEAVFPIRLAQPFMQQASGDATMMILWTPSSSSCLRWTESSCVMLWMTTHPLTKKTSSMLWTSTMWTGWSRQTVLPVSCMSLPRNYNLRYFIRDKCFEDTSETLIKLLSHLISNGEIPLTGLEICGILVANATMFSHLLPGFSCGSKHLLLP